MPHLTTHNLETDDGVSLTYHELGSGRPLVLLHGYNPPAIPIWVDTNIAERLANDGHRVIMPDLRGHGASVPINASEDPGRSFQRAHVNRAERPDRWVPQQRTAELSRFTGHRTPTPGGPPLRLDVFVDPDAGSPPTRDIRIAGG